MHKLINGILAAVMVLLLPLTAGAQEAEAPEAETPEVCTATIATIQAGEKVAAKAEFTEPFGRIVAIETSAESGLALITKTEEVEGEMAEMADEAKAGAEADAAVELADEVEGEAKAEAAIEAENASVFWLDATEATAGTYEITLKNEAGASCATEVTVEESTDTEVQVDTDSETGEEY